MFDSYQEKDSLFYFDNEAYSLFLNIIVTTWVVFKLDEGRMRASAMEQ